MFQPPGFVDPLRLKHVYLLRKSLYGLKQAPPAWFHHFATFIHGIGFRGSKSDPSLFIFRQGSDTAYLLLYVDDIVLTCSTDALRCRIMTLLAREFAMIDLGPSPSSLVSL